VRGGANNCLANAWTLLPGKVSTLNVGIATV